MPTATPDGSRLPFPPVFEIAGGSMEPSLLRGWKVRVAELSGDPAPGDLVLFETRSGHLLHRVVLAARFRDGLWVFHRGDAGGRTGLASRESAVGRVAVILDPPGQPLLTLDRLSPEALRAFERARSRSRLYAVCRRVAHAAGLRGSTATRLGGRLAGRLLG